MVPGDPTRAAIPGALRTALVRRSPAGDMAATAAQLYSPGRGDRMANLPGMGNPPTMPAQYAVLVDRVLLYSSRAVDGLTVEQLCDTHGGVTNSIGWDVWHVVRTIDNIIHFVFEREQPVWLQQGFDT